MVVAVIIERFWQFLKQEWGELQVNKKNRRSGTYKNAVSPEE